MSNAITWSVAPEPAAARVPPSRGGESGTRRLAALRRGPQWLHASRRSPLRKPRRTGVRPIAMAGSSPSTSARPWRLGNAASILHPIVVPARGPGDLVQNRPLLRKAIRARSPNWKIPTPSSPRSKATENHRETVVRFARSALKAFSVALGGFASRRTRCETLLSCPHTGAGSFTQLSTGRIRAIA